MTEGVARPTAIAGRGTLTVTDDRVFGPGGGALARRFARRVLYFDEVGSLRLDTPRATATLTYRLMTGDPDSFLILLADAVAGGDHELAETALPQWSDGKPVTLHHHAGIVSTLEILGCPRGHLRARDAVMARDPAIARRVENALEVVPGVIEASTNIAKGELRVRFDPKAVAALRLIRLAEAEIRGQRSAGDVLAPEPVDFSLANVSLTTAAVGSFLLPPLTLLTAGLLVLANLEVFGAAAEQLRKKKVGMPLLYTSMFGVTLASGQFLSAAVMMWLFRYWEQCYRRDLTVETRALLDESVSLPEEARVLIADGRQRPVPRRELIVGQRVRVLAGETVPADAIVRAGAALVDETAIRGTLAPVREVTGDQVLAGSRLRAGSLDVEVRRTGQNTRAAQIAQSLIETTVPAPRSWVLNRDAEEFARRAVAPTLIAAGTGLLVGGTTTAGAVLRPDYATGIGLAMPLEVLRGVKLAIRNGVVVRTANALRRLAAISWIVLDDHPTLHRVGCDVAEIRTKRLDENRLLPAVAAAGVWLGDERGAALVRACRERGLIVRHADLREIESDGVVVEHRGHLVRLRGRPVVAGAAPSPLIVEIDGVEAAAVYFQRSGSLEAATVVKRLKRDGLRVFLASERTAVAAGSLAQRLGVDLHRDRMSRNGKIRLLRELRRHQVAAAFVGDCLTHAPVACEAHVSISLVGNDTTMEFGWGQEPADIALLAPSIAPLPGLCALARDSIGRRERTRSAIMAANLLCVAGAFAFGFTPLAVVLVTNFGTSLVYNNAKRALQRAGARAIPDRFARVGKFGGM